MLRVTVHPLAEPPRQPIRVSGRVTVKRLALAVDHRLGPTLLAALSATGGASCG
eukprot:SAG31_NODE_45613_length_258_cov_0.647799_1_plen_53_part_01